MSQNTKISSDEIIKVAHLARLHVEEQEIDNHVRNLSKILDLIAEISTIDTTNVLPMTSPFEDAKLPLRDDQIVHQDERQVLQALAPQVEGGLYIVPKVIE